MVNSVVIVVDILLVLVVVSVVVEVVVVVFVVCSVEFMFFIFVVVDVKNLGIMIRNDMLFFCFDYYFCVYIVYLDVVFDILDF